MAVQHDLPPNPGQEQRWQLSATHNAPQLFVISHARGGLEDVMLLIVARLVEAVDAVVPTLKFAPFIKLYFSEAFCDCNTPGFVGGGTNYIVFR